jgi:hypothetical protein
MDENVNNINQKDAKRHEVRDNDGHLNGSRQQGNTQESMEKIRKEEADDNSELNQTDARGTVRGDETI